MPNTKHKSNNPTIISIHEEWAEKNGYRIAESHKRQATSVKRQAASVKRYVKQQALNVFPIVVCEGRCFPVIYQQTVDRFTPIKFYGARRGIFEQDKITLCPGHVK